MFAGTALSVRLFVCAGLSLFIIYGPYLYVVVCVFYTYNLTLVQMEHLLNCYVMVLHSVFALVLLCNCLLNELISHIVGVKQSLHVF